MINLLDDLRNIKKMTGIDPKRMIIYTAADWKWDLMNDLFVKVKEGDGRINPGEVIKPLMADPDLNQFKKMIPKLVTRMSKDIVKMGEDEKMRFEVLRNEDVILQSLAGFLSDEMECDLKVFKEDDPEKDDPMNKAYGASPLKPAIFIE